MHIKIKLINNIKIRIFQLADYEHLTECLNLKFDFVLYSTVLYLWGLPKAKVEVGQWKR